MFKKWIFIFILLFVFTLDVNAEDRCFTDSDLVEHCSSISSSDYSHIDNGQENRVDDINDINDDINWYNEEINNFDKKDSYEVYSPSYCLQHSWECDW